MTDLNPVRVNVVDENEEEINPQHVLHGLFLDLFAYDIEVSQVVMRDLGYLLRLGLYDSTCGVE